MKRHLMRIVALGTVLVLLGSGLAVAAAAPETYNEDGCLPLINEPGDSAKPLIFCRGDEDLTLDDVTWEDEEDGKAVRLNGVDEYFRIDYSKVSFTDFTLSLWVKWEGESAEEGGSGLENQRIFSVRGANRDTQYLTLSPMEDTTDGAQALRLSMVYMDSSWELKNPQGKALKKDDWCQLAIVGTDETLRLYMNGKQLDDELTMMSIAQMRPQQLYLGKGTALGGDGYFNGFLDNAYLYNRALSADELSELYENQKPIEAFEEEVVEAPAEVYALPTIPPLVWIVTGVTVALIVTLIVFENKRFANQNAFHPETTES